jgi:hypothetical protein
MVLYTLGLLLAFEALRAPLRRARGRSLRPGRVGSARNCNQIASECFCGGRFVAHAGYIWGTFGVHVCV